MDVTETPIERPKRKQKWFYSGMKKRRTLKCQIVIAHDFMVLKASGVHFHPDTLSLEDKGYQGIARYHANCFVPKKKPRHGDLSEADRDFNRTLDSERICIEYVNCRLKVFKILAQSCRVHSYRNLHFSPIVSWERTNHIYTQALLC